jgi:mannose-6-phosphate isomerase-like protein (cupin superfamily)
MRFLRATYWWYAPNSGDARKEKAMLRLVLILLGLAQMATNPIPATDVKSSDIQTVLKRVMVNLTTPVSDTPLRTVDAGGHNIGIGVVYRPKGAKGGSASHDKVSEVYQVLDGSGTLVTGGTIVNPQRRASGQEEVMQINGPGVSGTAIDGGVSRRITKGDMVIIPAGTPHWFSEVQEALTDTIVRIDPNRVVALK